MEQWVDAQGKSFKGEPAQALGPLALFRSPNGGGRLLPFGQLSTPDCLRFAGQLRSTPAPAADWSRTGTELGAEFPGNVLRVAGDALKPAELKGRPEPKLYVLFFVSSGEGRSWEVLGRCGWRLHELQKRYPHAVEGLMFGLKHGSLDHRNMAVQMKVPFLVADFAEQPKMRAVLALVPAAGFGLVVCDPNGVPLFVSQVETDEAAQALMAEVGNILEVIRPDNPKGWNDSEHFWKTAQPVLHAGDRCEPLLVGDPLNALKLRELGVESFEAAIDVSAEGDVTGVAIAPGAACPPDLLEPIAQALHQARLVPAVDHGRFVAGSHRYRFGGY